MKLARERALSAEESDDCDDDDHVNSAGCHNNTKVNLDLLHNSAVCSTSTVQRKRPIIR